MSSEYPQSSSLLSLCCWDKSIAFADRRHLQVQRSMLRMSTLIQQRLIRLLARENRYQNLALRVMLAKVITKSALPAMNCLHKNLLVSTSDSSSQMNPHRTPVAL